MLASELQIYWKEKVKVGKISISYKLEISQAGGKGDAF